MTLTTDERDRLYVDKAYQYLADTDFDGNVEQYLRLMVDEYTAQGAVYDSAGQAAKRDIANAKAAAYADALRVFDDAILAALRFAREA